MAHVCVPKELPAHLREDAARIAAFHNPANAPVRGLAAFVPPDRIAVLNSTYWGAKGVDLGVTFLDSTNSTLKNKILSYANKWGQYGNIRFRESAAGQVRLALKGDGYWSYIGTDILSIPKNDPTMTLDGFTLSTPDSEYDRVVCHEFGHTLGFPHEHERQEILSLLDVERTVAYFQTHVGWDRATTMQQVFTALDPKKITATAPDARSIMCYEFDGACTKSGQPIPGGNVIDTTDAGAVAKLYPLAVNPPPPPPPPEPVVTYSLSAMLKTPIGSFPITGTMVPASSAKAEVGPEASIPPEVLALLRKYFAVVWPVLLSDLPAVLWFKTKTWKDVLADVVAAVLAAGGSLAS